MARRKQAQRSTTQRRSASRNGNGRMILPIFLGGILAGSVVTGAVIYKLNNPEHETKQVASAAPQANDKAVGKSGTNNSADKALTQDLALANNKHASKPKFDFYTILPEMEVAVSDPTKPANTPTITDKIDAAENVYQPVPLTPAPLTPPTAAPATVNPLQTAEAAPEHINSEHINSEHINSEHINPEEHINPIAANPITPPHQLAEKSKEHGYFLQLGAFKSLAEADQLKAELTLNGYTVGVHSVNVNHQQWHRVSLGPFKNIQLAKNAQQQLQGKYATKLTAAGRE